MTAPELRSPFTAHNTQTMRRDRMNDCVARFYAYAMPIALGLAIAFAVIATWENIDFQYEESRDE